MPVGMSISLYAADGGALLQVFPKKYLNLMDNPKEDNSDEDQHSHAQNAPHDQPPAGMDGPTPEQQGMFYTLNLAHLSFQYVSALLQVSTARLPRPCCC